MLDAMVPGGHREICAAVRGYSLDARDGVHEAHVDQGVDVHRRCVRHTLRLDVEMRLSQKLVSGDEVRRCSSQKSRDHAIADRVWETPKRTEGRK